MSTNLTDMGDGKSKNGFPRFDGYNTTSDPPCDSKEQLKTPVQRPGVPLPPGNGFPKFPDYEELIARSRDADLKIVQQEIERPSISPDGEKIPEKKREKVD